jgi:hypothetical protein
VLHERITERKKRKIKFFFVLEIKY